MVSRLWPLTIRGTGALILAIACFVLARELGLVELVYFGVLLAVVLAASLASLYFVRRTESVTRSLDPEIAVVGRDATVSVQVGVRTAVPTAPGRWLDTLPRGLSGKAEGVFPALGSGLRIGEKSVELEYSVTGMQRGLYSLGPLLVASTDPFGLARRSSTLGGRTPVTVAPAIVDLPPLAEFAGDTGGTLHSTTNQLGQGADNLIARPYVSGDSMRRIHWRATAHRDELMVRQEEQESTPEAVVVLDRSVERWTPEAMRGPGLDARFEVAVSACVSVVAGLVRDGYSVDVIDSDGTPLAERIDGGDIVGADDLATAFASITARRDDHPARLSTVFAGSMTGPVVLITGLFEATDAAAIAPIVHHCALPILLAGAPTDDALDRAADLGWRTAAIDPTTDLALAWASAADRGVSHAFG